VGRRLAIAVGALALAGVLVSSGAAAPGGLPIVSYSDIASVPSASTVAVELSARRSVCTSGPTATASRTDTFEQAVASAQTLLGGTVKATHGLQAPALRRRGGGDQVAFLGVVRNKGGVALLGFLSQAAARPHDPLPLLNAAVIASNLGDQATSLGLLDAAARLPNPARAPMGIDLRALIANARGVALFRERRFGAAEPLFRTAAARAPLLSEARTNLAAALLCQGKLAAAGKAWTAGRRRNASIANAAPASSNAADLLPVPGQALDLSQGVAGRLPTLKIPPTSDAGAASAAQLESAYQQADHTYSSSFHDEAQAASQLEAALRAKTASFLYWTSISALYTDWQYDRPDLGAEYNRVTQDGAKLVADQKSFWLGAYATVDQQCSNQPTTAARKQCMQTDCAATVAGGHATWLPDANAANEDVHTWASDLYRYATALAANMHNPLAGQELTELARGEMYHAYASYLVLPVAEWANAEADAARLGCGPSTGDAEGETDAGEFDPSALCPPSLAAERFAISIELVNISVSCEDVTVEGKGLPEGITGFASVQYRFFDGTTTIFAGAATSGPLDDALDGDAHAGAYVTFDGSGNVTDCGLRANAEAGAKGPITLGPSAGYEWDYSLADSLLR